MSLSFLSIKDTRFFFFRRRGRINSIVWVWWKHKWFMLHLSCRQRQWKRSQRGREYIKTRLLSAERSALIFEVYVSTSLLTQQHVYNEFKPDSIKSFIFREFFLTTDIFFSPKLWDREVLVCSCNQSNLFKCYPHHLKAEIWPWRDALYSVAY